MKAMELRRERADSEDNCDNFTRTTHQLSVLQTGGV
jgi:hypothetical protein